MIFDEIDRGVGGATADAVGRRLSRLAQDAQVLVVTHSPQVAALGDRHFQVAKQQSANMTLSRVDLLSDTARVDEIARMISGDTITTEARMPPELIGALALLTHQFARVHQVIWVQRLFDLAHHIPCGTVFGLHKLFLADTPPCSPVHVPP